MRTSLRIAIADDHQPFRAGLIGLLHLQPGIRVVAEIDHLADVLPALTGSPCDILLLYLPVPRDERSALRAVAARVSVIVIAEGHEDGLTALRLGARGIVPRRLAIDALVDAIGAVGRGEVWLPPVLQAAVVGGYREQPDVPLTAREREIAAAVARGLRNCEVARLLYISEQTVKTHLNNIFHKLALRDRVELALYAARVGLIELHEDRDRPAGRLAVTAA